MSRVSIDERVTRGAELLEEKLGPEWVRQINLETLSIRDTRYCAGQTVGWSNRDDMLYDGEDPYPMDLDQQYGFDTYGGRDTYEELQAAWECEITQRLNELNETDAILADPDTMAALAAVRA